MDGLRGLAVLLVALAHCSNPNTDMHILPFLNFKAMGQSGVFLFFILSSYLLDRQIALAMMTKNDGFRYWANYFVRRFLRIFPLFFFSLIINCYLRSIGFRYSLPIESSDIIPHLFLRDAKGIYWSIPVEFKYYFLSPILMLIIKYITKWKTVNVLICSILFIAVFSLISSNFELDKISVLKFLPVFLIGSFLSVFELLKRDWLKGFSTKYYRYIDVVGLVSFCVILIFTGVYYYDLVFEDRGLFRIFRNNFVVQSIFYGFLLLAAKYGKGIIEAILEFKPLRFVGVISFSFYLFHMPVLRYFKRIDSVHDSISIVLFILATCFVSTLTFIFIEKPLSRVRVFKKSISEKDIR